MVKTNTDYCDECGGEFDASQFELLTVKREKMLPARHSAQIEPEYKTYYADRWLCLARCYEEQKKIEEPC